MAQTYAAFLASPSTSHLAQDASLNYITTTTVITEPTAILKHLTAQQKQVTTKEQKVLYTVEGPESLFLETETTVQFNNGGGAYLPSMDENLLDEKIVTFPLLHVVSFDADGKIKQIRLHWDQSTLLKQVEAIGRTGRNWPIRDGKAQIAAISNSLMTDGINTDKQKPLTKGGPNDVVIRESQSKRTSVSATRDPHASLALFAPRDPNEDTGSTYDGPKFAPRESAKPAPREYNELFANGEGPTPKAGNVRSPSPTKDGIILKAGAGKNYTGNRLFEEGHDRRQPSPERKKTYGQKYNHFDFGDGEDAVQSNRPSSNSRGHKHQPTFSFEDFATPPKAGNKVRRDDERHWGDEEDPPSPAKRNIVHAARKDADTHFKMTDESSPATSKPLHRQKGMGLYRDPLADDDGFTHNTEKSARTNMDSSRRGNDLDKHYQMTDSPQNENAPPQKGTNRSDMDQHWSFGTPKTEHKIYKTAGDGMGGKAGARTWGIGDSDPEDVDVPRRGRGGRHETQAGAPRF